MGELPQPPPGDGVSTTSRELHTHVHSMGVVICETVAMWPLHLLYQTIHVTFYIYKVFLYVLQKEFIYIVSKVESSAYTLYTWQRVVVHGNKRLKNCTCICDFTGCAYSGSFYNIHIKATAGVVYNLDPLWSNAPPFSWAMGVNFVRKTGGYPDDDLRKKKKLPPVSWLPIPSGPGPKMRSDQSVEWTKSLV